MMPKTQVVQKDLELHEDIIKNKYDIEIIKNDIQTIKDNHLHHIEKDINEVKNDLKDHKKEVTGKIDKMDNRLWWILGILISGVILSAIKEILL
jgi:hypothetical protein